MEYITVPDLKNKADQLRRLSRQSTHAPVKVIPRLNSTTTLGYIMPAPLVLDFMMSCPDQTLMRFLQANKLYNQRPAPDNILEDYDITLTGFAQRPERPGTAICIVNEESRDKIESHCKEREEIIRKRSAIPENGKRQTNWDILADTHLAQRKFVSRMINIREDTLGGSIIFQYDGPYASVSNQWALKLKERLHPGDQNIIQDVNSVTLDRNPGETLDPCRTHGKYLRVSRNRVPQDPNDSIERFTIVPAFAAEFFELNENGDIQDISKKDAIAFTFLAQASLSTNFSDVTKIRLLGLSIRQRDFIKKAAKTQGASLFGLKTSHTDNTETANLKKTPSFSYSDNAAVRVILSQDGKVGHLSLCFENQGALAGIACQTSGITEIHVTQDTHFTLAA